MTAPRLPEWLADPPEDGFTADDLDRIPDLPPHTELIDGSLVFVSAQNLFHMTVIDWMSSELRRQAPPEFFVFREMTTTLGRRQRPEPDLTITTKSAVRSRLQTDVPFEEVLVAVEVVSHESEIRDRERKPQLYAAAGVPGFWRVEDDEGHVVVYVHELGPDKVYRLVGTQRDRLVIERPFAATIDFTDIVETFKED
ncbi:Uma2 family endonuclease [Catenulispora sp. GP43]|uniref:Uma2 family endonuclease n=1 Tax=Catenulispora sp. GP43 TaxID=3156263 RepID=UPI003515D4BD